MTRGEPYQTAQELVDALAAGKITSREFMRLAAELSDEELEFLTTIIRGSKPRG